MKQFSALLQHKWFPSYNNLAHINGKWAEDETLYQIVCPPQLVESIVSMQNYVYELAQDIKRREAEIETLSKELKSFKAARGL